MEFPSKDIQKHHWNVNLLPCQIHLDGPAPQANQYFIVEETVTEAGKKARDPGLVCKAPHLNPHSEGVD
jgi:hypothetical protein